MVLKEISEMWALNVTDFILSRYGGYNLNTVDLSQEYKSSNSEIGMLPWNKNALQFCW